MITKPPRNQFERARRRRARFLFGEAHTDQTAEAIPAATVVAPAEEKCEKCGKGRDDFKNSFRYIMHTKVCRFKNGS